MYLHWLIVVQTIHELHKEKQVHFVIAQEFYRKDDECAFRMLKFYFHIIANPCWQWNENIIANILMENMVLYNMILDDKSAKELEPFEPTNDLQIK
jgi:superfamily I DNA and/or RNA helicase